ncbi:MAG TPA: IS110 family transposase [Isosphaeraceae bacterium]|nr:IS110 family transposase [Isosphaeraceae bacterium]
MTHPTTIRYVGLDVHKSSIVIAVADGERGPATILSTISNDFASLRQALHRLGTPERLSCCYEAGPAGYGLYRQLRAAGYRCTVIAPSLVPVQSGNRVKTDRRDAAKLAHFLRSGDLTTVHVPDEATEAIRDLERARDDAKRAEQVARHQLAKFLLRHGRRYEGKLNWNTAHLAWIGKQQFAQPSQQQVLTDYLVAVEQATERVRRLTTALTEQVATWRLAPLVQALQALRGIELVSAVTIVAEIEDFARFAQAKDLMAFVGLVPSEHSSGASRRQGRITRTGNGRVRRILVEAAWCYRFRPRLSKTIGRRNEVVAPGVRKIAWKAQQRLHSRLLRLIGRGKAKQQAVTAVARELAGFIWAIAREPALLAG